MRKKIQKYNFQNVVHTIEKKVKKIDQWKEQNLRETLHLRLDKLKKILHISTFDERNDHRLFNISISSKLTKGFIRNGHDVINFSYRSHIKRNLINKKII